MLIHIQFPIADMRLFAERSRLLVPNWPSPIVNEEFLRSTGIARRRWRGGLTGWVAEEAYCDAKRSLHFDSSEFAKAQLGQLRIAFRRFFFDGTVVAKFEIGISIDRKNVSKEDLKQVLVSVLEMKVRVCAPGKKDVSCKLFHAGRSLAALYATSSTPHAQVFDRSLVVAGMPVVFVEVRAPQSFFCMVPEGAKQVNLGAGNIRLLHWWIQLETQLAHIWFALDYRNSGLNRELRNIRLFLLRLNAEHQAFVRILKGVATDKIRPQRGSAASESFQSYLNGATSNILTLSAKACSFAHGDTKQLALVAIAAEETISADERATLLEKLEQLKIRKNVFKKVEVQSVEQEWTDQLAEHGPGNRTFISNYSVLNFNILGGLNLLQNLTKGQSSLLAFAFGVLFAIILLGVNIAIPNPTPTQWETFRIILALAAGGIGAMIPGILDVKAEPSTKFAISAGGALAVFIVVFFFHPGLPSVLH